MVTLYVKGKLAAKLESRAENCGEDMSGRLLCSDFYSQPFVDRFFRRAGRFWHHSDKPILPLKC